MQQDHRWCFTESFPGKNDKLKFKFSKVSKQHTTLLLHCNAAYFSHTMPISHNDKSLLSGSLWPLGRLWGCSHAALRRCAGGLGAPSTTLSPRSPCAAVPPPGPAQPIGARPAARSANQQPRMIVNRSLVFRVWGISRERLAEGESGESGLLVRKTPRLLEASLSQGQ